LTGAVASQKVTEAPKGSLRLVGNQPSSVKAAAMWHTDDETNDLEWSVIEGDNPVVEVEGGLAGT